MVPNLSETLKRAITIYSLYIRCAVNYIYFMNISKNSVSSFEYFIAVSQYSVKHLNTVGLVQKIQTNTR